MWKYSRSNFLGAIPPFTKERNRIMEQHYLGFRAQARNHFGNFGLRIEALLA
jgi:hypothetical protein